MTTLEERVQALEKELAERKHSEEMLTIAVRALVSKEAFEKLQDTIEHYQEQNGKLFNVLINQGTLHNERITNLQSQIIELDGKIIGQQTETRQQFVQIETTQQKHTTTLAEQKNLLTEILTRLPEKPL